MLGGIARMESTQDWRWLRAVGALLLGLLILAATLPSTGGMIEGSRPGMWRCGPFLFYPDAFFTTVGATIVATGCTLFGIFRRNVCEGIGWALLGLGFVVLLIGA
jgi:hypothetical protein